MWTRIWLSMALLLVSSPSFSQVDIPENAELNVFGDGWDCISGYRKAGDGCEIIDIPQNAELSIFGNDWVCNPGYRKVGDECEAVEIPQNAELDVFGDDWVCNSGYRKVGLRCELIEIPENAKLNILGNGWICNSGYRRVDDNCRKMTSQETEEYPLQMEMMDFTDETENKKIIVDGEQFTLSEISHRCEVHRFRDNYGHIECSDSKFRTIERKCEAHFPGVHVKTGELECSGEELKLIQSYCSATMYSDSYAEIDC